MTAAPGIPQRLTASTPQPSSPLTTPLALAGTSLISEMSNTPSSATVSSSNIPVSTTAQHALTQLASMSDGVDVPQGTSQAAMVGAPPGAVMVRTQYGVQMIRGQRPGEELPEYIYKLV